MCSLHFCKKFVFLSCIKTWNVFAHAILNTNFYWDRKYPKDLSSGQVKITVYPASDLYWVDKNILQKSYSLLYFIGNPYRKVASITLSSAVECSDLRPKIGLNYSQINLGKNVREGCGVK